MSLDAIDAEYAALRKDLATYFADSGKLAVVKAPPGSGKTHTLIEVLSSLVANGMQIAVAAQTNSQADDICRRWARDHPDVRVARFSSRGLAAPSDFPLSVQWVADKKELPHGAGITVATTAKWSLTDLAAPYDLLAIDEAWQMSWADLMQCAGVSEKFLMIGDPGQIPPVVPIDARRWETSPRAPHEAAPEVVLAEPTLASVRFVGSLPACRRLPNESVDFVKPFYDFDFEAYLPVGARGLEVSNGWGDALGSGRPLALTIPTPEHGPPIEVDHEVADATAKVVSELLGGETTIRFGDEKRPLTPADIGVTSSHRVMNSALSAVLASWANQIRVDTPERWQGLERPVMIALHPLSGVAEPSAFDLETGRLCVMASRHQVGFIMLTRNHVGETLRNYVPSAEQAPGRPDTVGRGHDAHLKFWTQLENVGSVVSLT
ncbi:AAA domain-containing protein [Geodermatophilus sp. SYSU D00708]